MVSIKYIINDSEEGEINPLRIAPYHPKIEYPFKKTATSFGFIKGDESKETEIILNEPPSLIKPALILLSAFFTWDFLT